MRLLAIGTERKGAIPALAVIPNLIRDLFMGKQTPYCKQKTNVRRLAGVVQQHRLADPASIHLLTAFASELFRMTSSIVDGA